MLPLVIKLILSLFGLLLYSGDGSGALQVAAFLAAVTLTSLCGYFQSRVFTRVCSLAYFGAAVFLPALRPFLPLFCFDLFGLEPRAAAALALVPIAAGFSAGQAADTAFLLALALLSLLLRYLCDKTASLADENIQITDTSREQSRVLQLQNKRLMEKQDYEIHLATLRERNRIAREIHDNVGHILSRSLLQAGALQTLNRDEALAEPLGGLRDTLSLAMDSIRGSVHDLRDESVDLHETLAQMLSLDGYEIRLEYDVSSSVPSEVKYCFITTVKEALTNVTKHSDATAIRVAAQEHPALYQLLIHDNGTKKPSGHSGGMGLSNMEERVRALGGQFTADFQNGFRIFISIPTREGTV